MGSNNFYITTTMTTIYRHHMIDSFSASMVKNQTLSGGSVEHKSSGDMLYKASESVFRLLQKDLKM